MADRSTSTIWLGAAALTLAAAAATAVATVVQSDDVRGHNQRLSHLQAQQDSEMTRRRLLLLERATFAGYLNVERVARDELHMRFPREIVQVAR